MLDSNNRARRDFNCHNVNVSCRKRDVCSMSQRHKKKKLEGRRAELNCKTNHVHIQKNVRRASTKTFMTVFICVCMHRCEKRKKISWSAKKNCRNTDKKSRTAHLVPKTNLYKCKRTYTSIDVTFFS